MVMSAPDYEYYGLKAGTWDLFRGDTSNWSDRLLYRRMVERYGEPVLDVGCGTGRILVDFLSEGVDIDGVDNSPEMLELCREKAAALGLQPNLYRQEMEALELPRRYRTILVPSSSFQLLTDPGRAQEAMARFMAHLLPGGRLVMPFMRLWREGEPPETEWKLTAEREWPDGRVARRWSRMRFDPADGCEHTWDRYQVLRDGEVIVEEQHSRSPATRSYTQREAAELFAAAGFTPVEMYHEFTFEPVRPEDALFTVVGRRG
jgi:ubiquinone/menaquinone biosynthesis C-methylase UbiE